MIWLHTHVYVAGIDVVTLTVIVTRNRSQGYTVVIVCINKMKNQPIKSLYVTKVSVELYFDLTIVWTVTRRKLRVRVTGWVAMVRWVRPWPYWFLKEIARILTSVCVTE